MDLTKLPKFTINLTRPERKVKRISLEDIAVGGLFFIPGKSGAWIKSDLVTIAGGRLCVRVGSGKTYTNFGTLIVTPCDRDGNPEYEQPERVMMRLADVPRGAIFLDQYRIPRAVNYGFDDVRQTVAVQHHESATEFRGHQLDTLVEVIGTVEFVGGGK